MSEQRTIQLGSEVKDRVTGFKGIAIARTEWLNGCFRYVVQPKMDKKGVTPEAQTFDEPQLEIIGKGIERRVGQKTEPKVKTGGPLPFKPTQHPKAVR